MQTENLLKELNKYISDRCEQYYSCTTLCNELLKVRLPINIDNKVEYLLKERVLLIQIIKKYQIEYKVIFTLI